MAEKLGMPTESLAYFFCQDKDKRIRLQDGQLQGEMEVVMDRVPDKHVGGCTTWSEKVAVPPEMRQLGVTTDNSS